MFALFWGLIDSFGSFFSQESKPILIDNHNMTRGEIRNMIRNVFMPMGEFSVAHIYAVPRVDALDLYFSLMDLIQSGEIEADFPWKHDGIWGIAENHSNMVFLTTEYLEMIDEEEEETEQDFFSYGELYLEITRDNQIWKEMT